MKRGTQQHTLHLECLLSMPQSVESCMRFFVEFLISSLQLCWTTVLVRGQHSGKCSRIIQGNGLRMQEAFTSEDKKVAPSIRYYKNLQDLQRSLPQDERGHDLVISSYALGELQTMKERISTIRQLWALTRDILVLIEPGTPQGSKLIRESRAHILALERKRFLRQKVDGDVSPDRGEGDKKGTAVKQHIMLGNAFVVAPCPHDGVCPMDKTDQWCHFIQRLERTPSQRTTKRLVKTGALRGYEDEKFSFVVLRRGIRPRIQWPLDGVELKLSEDEQQQDQEFKVDDYDSQSDGHSSSEELSSIQTAEDQSDAEESEATSDEKGYGSNDEYSTILASGDQSNAEESEATSGEEGKQVADLGSGWARIVFAPIRRGKHVFLDVCCSTKKDGSEGKLDRLIVSRSQDAVLHKQAKKSRWGDLWPSR
ncbi:hypothetical protein O6H91_06G104700 [Diphasiastrum complanatum]|uniref:Uncharacterized protein n=1 Tax=Diphasiastrum complanatum TaxID=34168 RepID=A0ACC2DHD4_DIPCM|nr:hypothetical protein O6H91_06G104700 [Diphasiastrum complanatum]